MRERFCVCFPKSLAKQIFTFCGLVLALPSIIMVVLHSWNTIPIVCFAMLDIPFLVGAFWVMNYRITVEGDRLSVRRGIGTSFSFELSDIIKVGCRINHTRNGTNGKMTIYTSHRKASVEPMMIGYKKMSDYIQKNIPTDKIITREITLSMPKSE